jgi:hypothetical protein
VQLGLSYDQRKCANDELLSYFQVEAPIHRPSFFLFFSLTIKDKTKISLTIKAKFIVYMTKKFRINLLILDFKLGTIDNRKDYLQTWGEFFFFIIIFFWMYTSLCIARVFDDHRSCQKLINYITNIKAKSKRYHWIQKIPVLHLNLGYLRKIGINFHQ